MSENKYFEKEWYTHLKKKYKLCDDDMEEYIDSFESMNKGNTVTSNILAQFINDEISGNNHLSNKECLGVIKKINLIVKKKEKHTLDLLTYLLYIIPICQNYVINKIGIREFFDSLDTDHDDKITCHELISVLYKINKNFTPNEIEKYKIEIQNLCEGVDTDNDGIISYDEFKKFMYEKKIVS